VTILLIVIKLGGSILEEKVPESFLEDLKHLKQQGHRVVIIHGGGKTVSEVSRKMGVEPQFIVSPKGFRSRYTDEDTIQIFTMVMAGKINKTIVSTILKSGLQAVGISGVDGGTVNAPRKKELLIVDDSGRKRFIDGDYSGKIQMIDPHLITLLLEGNYIPVVSPIAIGEAYELLNVDGDRLAAHVAGTLKADSLILFTNVEGLIIDGTRVATLTYMKAKEFLPKIGHGMITKLYAVLEALDMGVKEVRITSGLKENPIINTMNSRTGTLITYDGKKEDS
jgi:acetylglutamate/LysW-gamma-L-alpha-aminoadipate kinase